MASPRICVFGAGAIGGAVAARLALAGFAPGVVARGAHLAAIRDNGLAFYTPEGAHVVRLAATDDPAALGPQDFVIAAVKAHQLPAAAPALVPLLHERTAVVYALNGIPWWYFHEAGGRFDGRRLPRLDPGGALWDRVGVARAIGTVVNMPTTLTAPGVVHYLGGPNRLALGEPSGGKTARLEEIAAILRAAGIRIDTARPIREEIWGKASRLVASAPLALLTVEETATVLADPLLRDITRRGWHEALAIAAALGVPVDVDVEAGLDAMARLVGHRSSIVQDLAAGRAMEIDAQIVVPLELAHEAGVPVPTLDMLAALTLARLRSAGLYGA